MKYLKKFETTNELIEYFNSDNFLTPNVSMVVSSDTSSGGDAKPIVAYKPKPKASMYSFIDLGLPSGTKWAAMNIGATSIEDVGLLFAWGETQGYRAGTHAFNCDNYKYSTAIYEEECYDYKGEECVKGSEGCECEKYLTKCHYIKYTKDGLNTLELSDDAAYANYGSDWRVPSVTQSKELVENVEALWCTSVKGKEGILYISKVPGYTNRAIFLPMNMSTYSEGVMYPLNESTFYIDDETDYEYSTVNTFGGDFFQHNIGQRNIKYSDIYYSGNTGYEATYGFPIRPILISSSTIAPPIEEVYTHIDGTINGHDYVEVGGLKWATTNIGATSPSDIGLRFAWGDTQGYEDGSHSFSWANYKFGEYDSGDTLNNGMTKYNDDDKLTVLQPSDDAATVAWGNGWRMPTSAECQTFLNSTDFSVTIINGVLMYEFTDKIDKTKKVLFPFSLGDNHESEIWTSTLHPYITEKGGCYDGDGDSCQEGEPDCTCEDRECDYTMPTSFGIGLVIGENVRVGEVYAGVGNGYERYNGLPIRAVHE